ncbi:alpha/beta hydrolase [Bradyrhizobium lablabi]|uniref:alpha/beta fold hydrolase n=1 Tax=Bradyrhizobium lablabi TaxID=722472 RepID=UPI001BAC3D3A|nr:alpha/beta hydrolase [Bradyrhizobium lablabi]MBR1125425.1 alpha/beta hydrolase [Bradyrhizobium lablabi]
MTDEARSLSRDRKPAGGEPDARRRTLLGLPFLAPLASLLPFGAAAFVPLRAAAGTQVSNSYTEPLGTSLEGWPYPGPVQFLPLTMHGQQVRMAYMDFSPTAPANGRSVMLLHGKNFDSSYWTGPIGWLRGSGFRVVVPDQIGFNKSSKPDLHYTFEALAANTMALADALSLSNLSIIGHSTGGMLAVRLASIYPERIRQLVLEDPIGLVDYRDFVPPQTTETLEQAERRYTAETYRAFVARYFPILPPAEYEPFVEWRMRVALSGEYQRFVRATALTYQMIYHGPVRELFKSLKPPVLLLAGEHDRTTPLSAYAPPEVREAIPTLVAAAREVAKEIPRGQLVEFPGAGHVPHLEAAALFQTAVLNFLRS